MERSDSSGAPVPEMVWVYDSQYRRQYQTAMETGAMRALRQRFGGFKALVPCEELLADARRREHHLHGKFVNPREII